MDAPLLSARKADFSISPQETIHSYGGGFLRPSMRLSYCIACAMDPHGAQMNRGCDFGFALEEAVRLCMRSLCNRARGVSVESMGCKALLVLAGVIQQRFAQRMMVSSMSVGRLLDRLEGERLVSRRAHPGDRRARTVLLTRGARSRLLTVYQKIKESMRDALSGTSATDRRALMNGLHRVLSNFSSSVTGAPAVELSCGAMDEYTGDAHE